MKQQNIKDVFLDNANIFIKKNKLELTISKIESFVHINHNLNKKIIKDIFIHFQNKLLNSDKNKRNNNFILLFTPKQDSDIAKKVRYFLINHEEYDINKMQTVLLIITFQYQKKIQSDEKFLMNDNDIMQLNSFLNMYLV